MKPISRRHALETLGGFGVAAFFAACGSDSSSDSPDSPDSSGESRTSEASDPAGSTGVTTVEGDCVAIPAETAGPFPGDGSNGPNVLDVDGVVRADIRESVGGLSGVADGVELAMQLDVTGLDGCTPLVGAAVYAWQCDAVGRYSLYSQGATDQNYLRGVQVADAAGAVRFTTIFPGCYPGRWPHVHFAVYESLDAAISGGSPIATSQLAFPQAACEQVYGDERYPGSADALARLSLESDGVFRDDGATRQLASMSGTPDAGFMAVLPVAA